MSSAEPECGDCSGQGSTLEGHQALNPGALLSQRVFPLLGPKTSMIVKVQGRPLLHMPNWNRVMVWPYIDFQTVPYDVKTLFLV